MITSPAARPVLYLDIDGTIREGKGDALGRFVNVPEDVRVFPEAVTLMRRWKGAGGRIIGVSNQGGIALGYLTDQQVAATMIETHRQTGNLFDRIAWCRHHPGARDPEMARCWCRKPAPGLLIEAALSLAAARSEYYPPHLALMVGDRDEDQACARGSNVDFMWAGEWRATARQDEVTGDGRSGEPGAGPERPGREGLDVPAEPPAVHHPGQENPDID